MGCEHQALQAIVHHCDVLESSCVAETFALQKLGEANESVDGSEEVVSSGVEEQISKFLFCSRHLESLVARLFLEKEEDLLMFVFYFGGLQL